MKTQGQANGLKDNAHNYGFVVRYQPGKEASTGFMEEAWHVRYIGKEAKEVHDSGLTLEEYFGFKVAIMEMFLQPNQVNRLILVITFQLKELIPLLKIVQSKQNQTNTSPIITYYPAGDKVNYTSVLNNDGHVVSLSYYSGAQRYVAID